MLSNATSVDWPMKMLCSLRVRDALLHSQGGGDVGGRAGRGGVDVNDFIDGVEFGYGLFEFRQGSWRCEGIFSV